MSIPEDPPDLPRCPECVSSERIEPATDDEQTRLGCRWYAACCSLYFTGSAVEFQNHQAKKLARAAERGDLDASGELGHRHNVIGGDT